MSFALASAAWLALAWQGGLHPWQQALAACLLAALVWLERSKLPGWAGLGGWERLLLLILVLAGLSTAHSLRPQASLNATAALGLALAAALIIRRERGPWARRVAGLWMFGGGAFAAAFLASGLAAWASGSAPDPVAAARWLFPNQNLLAGGLVVPAMLVALASLAWGAPLRERIPALCVAALGVLALVWAGSRGAYLALGIGSVWLWARVPTGGWRSRGWLASALLCVAGLALWAPFSRLALRMQAQASPALQDSNYYRRVDFWKGAAALSLRSPFQGQGLGAFAAAAYGLDLPTSLTATDPVARYRLSLDHAHDEWLELAVELGWPLTLLLFACVAGWKLRRWRSKPADGSQLGLEAVLMAALALSLVDMNLRTPALAWGLMLSCCALEPALSSAAEDPARGPWAARLALFASVLAVLCLFGSALAQDAKQDHQGAQAVAASCLQPLDAGLAVEIQGQGRSPWPWSAWAGRQDPLWWWGQALASRDPTEQAADARRAVALRPYYAPGWYWLGLKLDQNRDPGGASQAMDQALRLEPNFCRALAWEADQARARGDASGARTLVRRIGAVRAMRVASPDPYTAYIQSVDPAWLKTKPQQGD